MVCISAVKLASEGKRGGVSRGEGSRPGVVIRLSYGLAMVILLSSGFNMMHWPLRRTSTP